MAEVKMPVSSVEMQEYLFSSTLVKVARLCEAEKKNVTNYDKLQSEVRECFRFQRFGVMNWLLMNGVSIPAELMSDQCHRPVGKQFPDQSSADMSK